MKNNKTPIDGLVSILKKTIIDKNRITNDSVALM